MKVQIETDKVYLHLRRGQRQRILNTGVYIDRLTSSTRGRQPVGSHVVYNPGDTENALRDIRDQFPEQIGHVSHVLLRPELNPVSSKPDHVKRLVDLVCNARRDDSHRGEA